MFAPGSVVGPWSSRGGRRRLGQSEGERPHCISGRLADHWIERDGEKTELDEDAVYTIKGNKWLKGDREISSIEIDPSFMPKFLDLTRLVDDERKGSKMEGVYKLDGDTMEWCCYTGDGTKQ